MAQLVFFIEQISIGLYILIGVAIFLTWRSMVRSRRALRSTYFELERGLHRDRWADSATTLVLLLELVLVIVGVQRVVAPAVRQDLDLMRALQTAAGPQDEVFITPTPQPLSGGQPIDASGVQLGEEEVLAVFVTPTLTPTPVGTIIPNAPPVVGCEEGGGAELQVPANGMVVHEPRSVIGIADTDDFAFYRFELRGPSTLGNFAILNEFTLPSADLTELGQIVPSFYEPGEYEFRLTVFDTTNTLEASCLVTIYIREPIPTATPLGFEN